MQVLSTQEVEEVNGGSIGLAVVTGLAIGTLVVGAYILWDAWS